MRRRVDGVVVALLLLAAAARLAGLGARSLWFDEALSGLIARLSTAQVLSDAAGSSHPFGYYLLLHLWRPLGESEFALRFPSAWCSLVAVALVARIGRDLFGRRVARLAALGMAVSPFQVYYAQEARMYGLAIALSAGVLWAFLRGVRGDGKAWWVVYGVLAAIGLYVHYYIALVILALHLWLLLGRRCVRRVLVLLVVTDSLIAIAFLPQLVRFLIETGEYLGGVTSWQPRPTLLSPITSLYFLLFGHVLPLGWVGVGLFLVLAMVAFAGLSLARRSLKSEAWAQLFVITVPLLVILVVSFIAHSIYSERSFAVTTPALVLLLAWAVVNAPSRSPTRYLGLALAALMVVGTGFSHFRADLAKPPLRESIAVVTQQAQTTDVVLHLQEASYLPMLYYAPDAAGVLANVGQDLWLTPETHALFNGQVAQSADLDLADQVWLTVMPGYIGSAQTEWLAHWDADHVQIETWDRGAVQVRLYAPQEGR